MNKRFFLNFFFLLFILISDNSLAELIKRDLIINNSDNEIKIFNVEIADTEYSRNKGLMWREYIPNGTGMLFVWEREAYRNFWMKNTPSSLDILFFDKDGKYPTIFIRKYSIYTSNKIRIGTGCWVIIKV